MVVLTIIPIRELSELINSFDARSDVQTEWLVLAHGWVSRVVADAGQRGVVFGVLDSIRPIADDLKIFGTGPRTAGHGPLFSNSGDGWESPVTDYQVAWCDLIVFCLLDPNTLLSKTESSRKQHPSFDDCIAPDHLIPEIAIHTVSLEMKLRSPDSHAEYARLIHLRLKTVRASLYAGEAMDCGPYELRRGGVFANTESVSRGEDLLTELVGVTDLVGDAADDSAEPAQSSKPTSRMSKAKAGSKARDLLALDDGFAYQTVREWADKIGCSPALVQELPVRKAVMEHRREWADRPKEPNAVCLSEKALATTPAPESPTANDERDSALQELMRVAPPEKRAQINAMSDKSRAELAELFTAQKADAEPSPVDDDPSLRSPRDYKKV